MYRGVYEVSTAEAGGGRLQQKYVGMKGTYTGDMGVRIMQETSVCPLVLHRQKEMILPQYIRERDKEKRCPREQR